jgi:hypothetical protein
MSGKIQNNIITVRQGDSFALNLQINDENGPVDLSGAELSMQVRNSDDLLMFEVQGTTVSSEEGKMVILLTPGQTNIAVGEYKCDIQLLGSDGSVNTIFPANINQIGAFIVTEQVTR